MNNITFVSGYWLPPEKNSWWRWKNSHHNFEESLARLFSSLNNISKSIRFVFLYNKYSRPILPLGNSRVTFWDITDYYDWERPYSHWVKFALIGAIWKQYGPYIWFDADTEFTEQVSNEDLVWIERLKEGIAFLAVVPKLTTTYEQFGMHLDLTYEMKRERLEEIFGFRTRALVNTAIYAVNSGKYVKTCQKIEYLVRKEGITPYDDEWGHVVALYQMGISLKCNKYLSLRILWPKCIKFHHDVTRFYNQNYY